MNYIELVTQAFQSLYPRFVNESRIVTVHPNADTFPGEGNGLLQSGLAYCIWASAAPLKEFQLNDIEKISRGCAHEVYPIFWRSPFKRNPGDNQQHDDYWGWLAALYHAGSDRPLAFYDQAEHWAWFIDIQNPGSRAHLNYYFGRFPGFRIFAKACARALPLTLTEHLTAACVGLYKAWKPGASDEVMRDYCFFSVMVRESVVMRPIGQLWLSRVRTAHGSTGAAFKPYFQFETTGHPLCTGDWDL